MHYSYLLLLSNNDYYAGSTDDVVARFREHQSGGVPHTSKYLPAKLVWFAGYKTKELAVKFEKYLKSSSGKAFRNKHLV